MEIFVESPDQDVVGSLDKILVLPPEEVKTSLILPLSETQAVIRKSKMKPVSFLGSCSFRKALNGFR